MSDMSITDAVVGSGVVAVLRAPTADAFAAVSDVLVEAGITALEVTLTSRGALEAIAGLRRQLPAEVAIGAGTVLTVDDAKASVDAGKSLTSGAPPRLAVKISVGVNAPG